MIDMKNFITAVAQDCYYAWTDNVPACRIRPDGFDKETFDLFQKVEDMIENGEKWLDIEAAIIDIYTAADKKGFLAGFEYALALCGVDLTGDSGKGQA